MKKIARWFAPLLLGCSPQGSVSFSYALSQVADGSPDAAAESVVSCAQAGVASVAFLVGDDLNGNGQLDDDERDPSLEAELPCVGGDANQDGAFVGAELGAFSAEDFPADLYDLFAFEFRDAAGVPLLWRTVQQSAAQARVSFRGGFEVLQDRDATPALPGAVAGVLPVFLVLDPD